MQFHLVTGKRWSPDKGFRTAYLEIDHWNDYSFVTMFYLSVNDETGNLHKVGNVKIGFKGQDTSKATFQMLDNAFETLPEGFFSLGSDIDYYQTLAGLSKELKDSILGSLKDMVFDSSNIEIAQNEDVFRTSLLRSVSLSTIKGQFPRVLDGRPPLTNFKFLYQRPAEVKMAGIELYFKVDANSKPSTNIHTIIGRNGLGKTTLLNGMIDGITNIDRSVGQFFDKSECDSTPISKDYFSSLVSVSFSAFDPFDPPIEQPDPSKGTCYFYIGLKNNEEGKTHDLKTIPDLHLEFIQSLKTCFSEPKRKRRWENAMRSLESDENFSAMHLPNLLNYSGKELVERAISLILRMSSGHTVVLLTITKLVAKVEEKTLVLIDEPESHLHPPLLSAFIRSLSELLHDRNGVAIIATHSPVVLQEVPRSCVWKINRSRLHMTCIRPEEETFGENVGTLTREIFGLEVEKSGFHNLLNESVDNGGTYEEILDEYKHQLGFEAKAILKSMVIHRDRVKSP